MLAINELGEGGGGEGGQRRIEDFKFSPFHSTMHPKIHYAMEKN